MTSDEIKGLVADIQVQRFEPDAVEVKAAHGGTPNCRDSLSSFANRTGGGTILLGLAEVQNFAIVGVDDPQRIQEDISSWARDVMNPSPTIEFTLCEIDGHRVMTIEVLELATEQKPCFDSNKGLRNGTYIRVGGTDRPMSDYEIFGYVNSRGQPLHDELKIEKAGLDDLDESLIDSYIETLRSSRPEAGYLVGGREEILRRLSICDGTPGSMHPTLAGLLMFGTYPQQFFPQLMITFTQFYGTTEDENSSGGERFLDNQRFE